MQPELEHGYTEQTEDGIIWRIDRRRPVDRRRPYNYEDIINEQTVGSLATLWHRSIQPLNQEYNIHCIFTETTPDKTIEECGICYEPTNLHDMVTLNCAHIFCVKCIHTILTTCNVTTHCCAFCRTQMTRIEVKNQEAYNTINNHCL
jgi:hypothetical protein